MKQPEYRREEVGDEERGNTEKEHEEEQGEYRNEERGNTGKLPALRKRCELVLKVSELVEGRAEGTVEGRCAAAVNIS
ncbi:MULTISPECIES: hypothetical protein [unclassified Paraflavitalea]|uniref:hypothetical protein n=1 Tax=unclassified Paraflavitalea TaxID=2798305 RepID=UPI003D33F008